MAIPKLSTRTKRKMGEYQSATVGWILYPFQLIGGFFSSAGSTLVSWWNARNLRLLLQGLPALLTFIGVVVLANFCFFQDRSVLANSYQARAKLGLAEALSLRQNKRDASKSLSLAQTCYNRLTYLQPDNPDNRYFLALAFQERAQAAAEKAGQIQERVNTARTPEAKAEQQKELDKATEEILTMQGATARLMNRLAPLDRKGYGRAHLWLVQQLYRFSRAPDGKMIPPSPAAILDAERHLIHALEWTSDDVVVGAHFGLAKMYRDTNRIEESKRHLTEVAMRHPEYRLTLAQWAVQQNESNDAVVSHAKAAENAFRSRLTTSVDDHEARFGLVECLMLQNKYEDAQAAINKGATLATQGDLIRAYARKMTQVLIQWSDFKEKDPKNSLTDRLGLLDQALTLDPDNPELFNRLLKLTKDKGPEADKARAVFRNFIVTGKGSAMAHLFLGIDAWQQDNAKEATYHWEKAFEISQGAPLIANNLAWVLAFSPPVDLKRALDLANAAVAKMPNEPRFRGTRGHILAKLDRNEEALKDLEAALKVYPNDPRLYKVLAEVSAKLGHTKMAQEYKAKSEILQKQSGTSFGPTATPDKKPDGPPSDELKPPPGIKAIEPKTPGKDDPKPPGGN